MPQVRLDGVGFFDFLTPEEREELSWEAEAVVFEPGESLIEEGGEPGGLFAITAGTVEVSKALPDGGERLLAIMDAGQRTTVVGERGLLGRSGASATVRAGSAVEAVKVPRETFRRMISEGKPAAYKLSFHVSRLLAERLTRLDEEVVEAIREIERRGETDFEAFRDRLIDDWTT
jgi:CRP/FNR family transcriptional regulator, cyclic AMP receptor protein